MGREAHYVGGSVHCYSHNIRTYCYRCLTLDLPLESSNCYPQMHQLQRYCTPNRPLLPQLWERITADNRVNRRVVPNLCWQDPVAWSYVTRPQLNRKLSSSGLCLYTGESSGGGDARHGRL